RADQSTSQAFESDNDATATYNQPNTSAIFSNITAIGPLADTANSPNARFGAAAQIRRNSRQSIFNSVFAGWPRGIEIAQVPTMSAALADSLQIRNNSWYGVKGTGLNLAGGTPPAGIDANWIAKPEFGNVLDRSTPNNAMLENAFAEDVTFNPVPKSGSPLLGTASFTKNGIVAIDDAYFEKVTYRGAMGLQRWDLPWANYDPINTDYKAQNPSSVDEGSVKGGLSLNVTPNPAIDRVRVRYEITQTSHVSIRLYNASGSLNATIIGNQSQEPGIYEFFIDTQDIASGMYYMQIITDQGVRTETISVIR
ncbi:T9SS C-terminal target domain-containing protein, partial [bacterium]|nr:T9SS C-terminal target domain-containing protein [bacterium]